MAVSVCETRAGWRVSRTGLRSSNTVPTSTACCDCTITAPAAIGVELGCAGSSRLTYFWPNSVFGMIVASTFAGMIERRDGVMASSSRACVPSALIDRTSPMRTPRSFTSAGGSKLSPAAGTINVIPTACCHGNALRYDSTNRATSIVRTSRNPIPTYWRRCSTDVSPRSVRSCSHRRTPG